MSQYSELDNILMELRYARTGYIEAQIGVESGFRGLLRKTGSLDDSNNEQEMSYLWAAREVYYKALDSYRHYLLSHNDKNNKFILEMIRETVFDELSQLRSEKEARVRMNGVRGLLRSQMEDWREVPPAFKMAIGAFFALTSLSLGWIGFVNLIWLKGGLLGLGAILFVEGFMQRSFRKRASVKEMNRAGAFRRASMKAASLMKKNPANPALEIMKIHSALEDDIASVRKFEKRGEVKRYAVAMSAGMLVGCAYLIPANFVSGIMTLIQTAGMIAFSRIIWMAMPQGAMAASSNQPHAFSIGEGVPTDDLSVNDQYVNYFSRAPISDPVLAQASQNNLAFDPTQTSFVAAATAVTSNSPSVSLSEDLENSASSATSGFPDTEQSEEVSSESENEAEDQALVATAKKPEKEEADDVDEDDRERDNVKSNRDHEEDKKSNESIKSNPVRRLADTGSQDADSGGYGGAGTADSAGNGSTSGGVAGDLGSVSGNSGNSGGSGNSLSGQVSLSSAEVDLAEANLSVAENQQEIGEIAEVDAETANALADAVANAKADLEAANAKADAAMAEAAAAAAANANSSSTNSSLDVSPSSNTSSGGDSGGGSYSGRGNEEIFIPSYTDHTCFVAGQRVTMADGTCKKIEDVLIGEKVKGQDGVINTVQGYERPFVGSRKTYIINGEVEFTGDHPFLSESGWKVADLDLFKAFPRGLSNEPTQLAVGDVLITENGKTKIEKLEESNQKPADEMVYDLKLDGNNTYIVEGFVVHNCDGSDSR